MELKNWSLSDPAVYFLGHRPDCLSEQWYLQCSHHNPYSVRLQIYTSRDYHCGYFTPCCLRSLKPRDNKTCNHIVIYTCLRVSICYWYNANKGMTQDSETAPQIRAKREGTDRHIILHERFQIWLDAWLFSLSLYLFVMWPSYLQARMVTCISAYQTSLAVPTCPANIYTSYPL